MIQKRSHQVLALLGVNLMAFAASAGVFSANDSAPKTVPNNTVASNGASQGQWIKLPQGHKGRTAPAPTSVGEKQSESALAVYQLFAQTA